MAEMETLARMAALSPRPPHFREQARLIRANIKAAKAAAVTKP